MKPEVIISFTKKEKISSGRRTWTSIKYLQIKKKWLNLIRGHCIPASVNSHLRILVACSEVVQSLNKYERETVINYCDAFKIASISTSQEWMKRRIRKLAERKPDDVKIISEDRHTLIAEFPRKWLRIQAPPELTQEQRDEMANRLKKYQKNKK